MSSSSVNFSLILVLVGLTSSYITAKPTGYSDVVDNDDGGRYSVDDRDIDDGGMRVTKRKSGSNLYQMFTELQRRSAASDVHDNDDDHSRETLMQPHLALSQWDEEMMRAAACADVVAAYHQFSRNNDAVALDRSIATTLQRFRAMTEDNDDVVTALVDKSLTLLKRYRRGFNKLAGLG